MLRATVHKSATMASLLAHLGQPEKLSKNASTVELAAVEGPPRGPRAADVGDLAKRVDAVEKKQQQQP
eukprot:6817992-Lingulodinium_polyedra.AAC.1